MRVKLTATVSIAIVMMMFFVTTGPTTYSWYSDSDEVVMDVSIANVVKNGTYGGTFFNQVDDDNIVGNDTLVILPADSSTDPKCGCDSIVFEAGAWREAVVYYPNGEAKAIGGYPCDDVNAIKHLIIADGVTSIGSFTAKFPNLEGEVVIPASVTYIGQEAFQNCEGITKLTFEEGGTKPLCIAPGAFKNIGVKEIVLPADRPEIHIHCWAFVGCKELENITFPANVTTFSGWTHVDYCGMDYVNGWDSCILNECNKLKTVTFGSQYVKDLFFNSPNNIKSPNNNYKGIDAARVEIIVQNPGNANS